MLSGAPILTNINCREASYWVPKEEQEKGAEYFWVTRSHTGPVGPPFLCISSLEIPQTHACRQAVEQITSSSLPNSLRSLSVDRGCVLRTRGIHAAPRVLYYLWLPALDSSTRLLYPWPHPSVDRAALGPHRVWEDLVLCRATGTCARKESEEMPRETRCLGWNLFQWAKTWL